MTLQPAPTADGGLKFSEERTARVGDVELCWQEMGSQGDPPVLMVMGLGAQMILWPDELCALIAAQGFRVIRFDNRDAGRSTWLGGAPTASISEALRGSVPDGAYRLTDMAADTAALLDALGISAAHVVGASLGGMIAQTLAIEHPDRALSLASIMSTTGDRSVGRPTPTGLEALTSAPPADRDGYVEALVRARRLVGSPGFPFDEAFAREIAGRGWDRGYNPKGTVRQTVAIIASGDRTERLRKLDVPTVVIHGDSDPLIDISGGRATAAVIPGAELVVIEGMGHDFPAGARERVADEIVRNAARASGRIG
ncbi:alpha/beta hydrolase [soil metagenome]